MDYTNQTKVFKHIVQERVSLGRGREKFLYSWNPGQVGRHL